MFLYNSDSPCTIDNFRGEVRRESVEVPSGVKNIVPVAACYLCPAQEKGI